MSPKDTASSSGSRATSMVTPGRIGILVLVVLVLVFIFENTQQVRIRLLIPEVSMPLYLALAAVALIGAACGAYFATRRRT
ncbi:DUF1049 domain-containing protein [Streptomyces sp. SID5785]|uniref:lipopolysaccharide assembly protein LapA domain-containing protein n=1 Tax=Streptomyces sp. SID5785 TaxID=2690309 RepID=UPI0013617CCF|nr:lipopolysaccharide assembly protein LapA domain-containing protein [Streptomyces sp. SID5785]MZD05819.1 DUF1049 domain-containing protein [Streptomyces sp. SID5785]